MERKRDGTGTEEVGPAPDRERYESSLLRGRAQLDYARRVEVARAIEEVCAFRGWTLHALNVRSNHVHVVVTAPNIRPERPMNQFKSWATRRLRDRGLAGAAERLWTRHGSTRYLWDEKDLSATGAYVLEGQGSDLGGVRSRDETKNPTS